MKKSQIGLWILQAILAALFLVAGSTKFQMTVEMMNQDSPVALTQTFLYFIGVCEILGALGLILPLALKIKPILTPLAACGLLLIMLGATGLTLIGNMRAVAAIPFVVGLLLSVVIYGRRDLLSKAPSN